MRWLLISSVAATRRCRRARPSPRRPGRAGERQSPLARGAPTHAPPLDSLPLVRRSRRRFLRSEQVAGATKENGPALTRSGRLADYCRQRPTLPCSFPHSTIGGSRLNFRVRNGNGCDPAPMTTGMLEEKSGDSRISGSSPPQLSRCQRASGSHTYGGRPGQLNTLQTVVFVAHAHAQCIYACKNDYGQASRLISIGKLNVSPRLHTRPITWSSSRSL